MNVEKASSRQSNNWVQQCFLEMFDFNLLFQHCYLFDIVTINRLAQLKKNTEKLDLLKLFLFSNKNNT